MLSTKPAPAAVVTGERLFAVVVAPASKLPVVVAAEPRTPVQVAPVGQHATLLLASVVHVAVVVQQALGCPRFVQPL